MITTLSRVKKAIQRNLDGFEDYPAKNDFDRGYKVALEFVKSEIEKDKRYINIKESP